MEKLKAGKSLTLKKVGDFGASFGWGTGKSQNNHAEWLKELRSEKN